MSQTSSKKSSNPEWYSELPSWTKIVFQLGFATVFVAYVFITSREDRAMFREELQAERAELREAVLEFRKAVERTSQEQHRIKGELDNLKKFGNVIPPPHPFPNID